MIDSSLLELKSSFKGTEFYTEDFSKNYAGAMAKKFSKSPSWSLRMARALKEHGWSIPQLARRMGREDDRSLIDSLYKYQRGEVDNPRGEVLDQIANALGIDRLVFRHGDKAINSPSGGRPTHPKTRGEVAANVFRDVDAADDNLGETDDSPLPADPRYPLDAQYDLIVRGTSINRLSPDGHRLRVLDIQKAGIAPTDGEFVIVRRRRDNGQIVETTAKRLIGRALWPDSDDPRWQTPLPYDDGDSEVEIIGKVLFTFQVPSGSRK